MTGGDKPAFFITGLFGNIFESYSSFGKKKIYWKRTIWQLQDWHDPYYTINLNKQSQKDALNPWSTKDFVHLNRRISIKTLPILKLSSSSSYHSIEHFTYHYDERWRSIKKEKYIVASAQINKIHNILYFYSILFIQYYCVAVNL